MSLRWPYSGSESQVRLLVMRASWEICSQSAKPWRTRWLTRQERVFWVFSMGFIGFSYMFSMVFYGFLWVFLWFSIWVMPSHTYCLLIHFGEDGRRQSRLMEDVFLVGIKAPTSLLIFFQGPSRGRRGDELGPATSFHDFTSDFWIGRLIDLEGAKRSHKPGDLWELVPGILQTSFSPGCQLAFSLSLVRTARSFCYVASCR